MCNICASHRVGQDIFARHYSLPGIRKLVSRASLSFDDPVCTPFDNASRPHPLNLTHRKSLTWCRIESFLPKPEWFMMNITERAGEFKQVHCDKVYLRNECVLKSLTWGENGVFDKYVEYVVLDSFKRALPAFRNVIEELLHSSWITELMVSPNLTCLATDILS